MWSHNVHVQNATIRNGDDCITVKSGSSNVMVEDLHCKGSHGITVGSVWYDNVVNVTYRRVVMEDCAHGTYEYCTYFSRSARNGAFVLQYYVQYCHGITVPGTFLRQSFGQASVFMI